MIMVASFDSNLELIVYPGNTNDRGMVRRILVFGVRYKFDLPFLTKFLVRLVSKFQR